MEQGSTPELIGWLTGQAGQRIASWASELGTVAIQHPVAAMLLGAMVVAVTVATRDVPHTVAAVCLFVLAVFGIGRAQEFDLANAIAFAGAIGLAAMAYGGLRQWHEHRRMQKHLLTVEHDHRAISQKLQREIEWRMAAESPSVAPAQRPKD